MVFDSVKSMVNGLVGKFSGSSEPTLPDTSEVPQKASTPAKQYATKTIDKEMVNTTNNPASTNPAGGISGSSPLSFSTGINGTPQAPWYNQGNAAANAVSMGETGMQSTESGARQDLSTFIRTVENPSKQGFQSTINGKRFMPIESPEGDGGNPNMSQFEIGYGIKIEKDWLSDDATKWLKVDGVPIDLRKGITEGQAERLVTQHVDRSMAAASELPNYDKMTPQGVMYWADLAYNGGNGAFKKNPEAMKALKEGYTTEGILRTMDFITANGEPMRGLLKRRIDRYNKMAVEVSGVPVIKSYTWGKDISVEFSYDFMTDTVSDDFVKTKMKGNNYRLRSGKGTNKTYKVD